MVTLESVGISQETLSKQHCGLYRISADEVVQHMPDLKDIMSTFPYDLTKYTADVKVHMLKKGMYPCIPNWHHDLVPRDVQGHKQYDKVDINNKLFLYLSGPPYTEFPEGEIEGECWNEFTQLTIHRGQPAEETCWRLFIRLAPKEIYAPRNEQGVLRRHAQVYLDKEYTW